jgi:hypothetical protein
MILNSLPEVAEVIVHVDPCEDPLCKRCQQYKCKDRSEANEKVAITWRVEEVVVRRVHRENTAGGEKPEVRGRKSAGQ